MPVPSACIICTSLGDAHTGACQWQSRGGGCGSAGAVLSDSAAAWTAAHQAPPSTGRSRQEYWSGLLFPSPGDLPDPGIEPRSPALRADALPSEPPGETPVETVM